MSTIQQLKTANDAAVTNKTAPNSISPNDVGGRLNSITDEFLPRGVRQLDTITDLASVDPLDYTVAIVKNVGIYFHTAVSQTVDGYRILDGSSGFWVLQNTASATSNRTREGVEMANVNVAGIESGLEPTTGNGALSTATVTTVDGGANFIVTAGDHTSWLSFNDHPVQDNGWVLKARIRTDVVGATAPLVGVGWRGFNLTNDTTGAVWFSDYYINLLTKEARHKFQTGSTAVGSINRSSAGAIAEDEDVIELTMRVDYPRGYVELSVINERTGEFLYSARTSGSGVRVISLQTHVPKIILADGTYTLLDLKVYSSVGRQPLLGIVGDSYACGDAMPLPSSLLNMLRNAMPGYDTLMTAGNGAYINSMSKYQLRDILRLKPRYVLFLQVLNLFWGYYDDGDANQTEWDNGFNAMMDAITGYGGIPILMKWPTAGGFIDAGTDGAAASANWDAKRATIISAYPTTLTLDVSGVGLNLSNVGHPTVADNRLFTIAITELLRSVNAI